MLAKKLLLPVLLLYAVTASPGHAQGPDAATPQAATGTGAKYPLVHADGSVTFRVKAPKAQSVQVVSSAGRVDNNGSSGLGNGPYTMVKDEQGVWTVTTPPAVPGLHEYSLVVDGLRIADPANPGPSRDSSSSAVEVPEPGVDFYYPKPVPHGDVRTVVYFSNLTQTMRRTVVYTPPGYDAHPATRYPVLYLLHGGGQNETLWTSQGFANYILDNLIASGKARPMIVAMDYGYAQKPGEASIRKGLAPGSDQPPPRPDGPIALDLVPALNTTIEQVYMQEVLPNVDAHFRTLADRDHRAIAGLSMGSGQAFAWGCNNLDKFSYIGLFSRAPYQGFDPKTIFHGVFANPADFNRKVHLFYWNTGTAEPAIYQFGHTATAELKKMGIAATLVEEPGTSHEWQTWRKALNDFAPRLFP